MNISPFRPFLKLIHFGKDYLASTFPRHYHSTIMPFFFFPSTSQSDFSFGFFGFGWNLSRVLPHSSCTFSVFRYSLANLSASSLLIVPFILVLDVIVLKFEVQKKSTTVVERKVWGPFVGVKRDERDASMGKPFGWKRWWLGTWFVTLVLGKNGSSWQALNEKTFSMKVRFSSIAQMLLSSMVDCTWLELFAYFKILKSYGFSIPTCLGWCSLIVILNSNLGGGEFSKCLILRLPIANLILLIPYFSLVPSIPTPNLVHHVIPCLISIANLVPWIPIATLTLDLRPMLGLVKVRCEEFLHTFHMKICTHKTHLGVELACNCSLTSKGGSI